VAIRDSSVTASKARFGAVKRAEEDEMGGGALHGGAFLL
jgi:hypothetical protein